MIALVTSEIKKLFKNKLYFFLLLALLFLPTLITLKGELSESAVFSNGEIIEGYDYIKKKIEIGRSLSGKITEEWLEKQKERLKEDSYFETVYIKNAIFYGNFILNQEWEKYDGREKHYVGLDEDGNPIYEYEETTKQIEQENEFIKQQFRNMKHFYYGETTIIPSIMRCLCNTGAFLAFYILILFSTIFNKEVKEDRNALLKSTKQGKRKLTIAKILTTILISLLIPVIIIAFVFIIHVMLFGFPDMKANYQIFTQVRFEKIIPFTFQEALLLASGLYIVGSLIIGILSMLLSSIIKSSYRSLVIGFIILILPIFLNIKIGTFPIKNIFPLTYMNTGYEMLTNLSTIGNHSFYDVVFILKSFIISIILIPITYFIDRKEMGKC